MKYLKHILITYLILTTYSVFSQSTDFKQYVRLETGLGLNFCKNKIDERFVYGYPKVEAIPLVRPGYNFYSNASILLHKKWRVNAGIDITALNHSIRGKFSNNSGNIDFVFRNYQWAVETPLSISYEFLDFGEDFLSIEAGLKYSSLVNLPFDMGYGLLDSSEFVVSTSADIYATNKAAIFINIPVFFRLSYYYKLKNKDYIRFFINYLHYGPGMDYTVTRYWVWDKNEDKLGAGEIKGYYGNVSFGAYYSFSFERYHRKIYNKGFEQGKKAL